MTTPQTALDPLDLDSAGPVVVAIGGGHGLAQVLEATLGYAGQITAVVTVSDDGGSSGRLQEALRIPPPGDVRKCLLALSPEPSLWRELLGYRFEEADVAGHSLGNLMLGALAELTGDFRSAVRTAEAMLGARGRVVPAAPRALRLEASIDGRLVAGQTAIARSRGTIEELRLDPGDVAASPEALEAILAADQLVLAAGSLFTSLIATLLVPGVVGAVEASEARRVLVLNLVTQDGETLGMSGTDHVEALRRLTGLGGPAVIVVHEGELDVPVGVTRVELTAADGQALGWEVAAAAVADPEAAWPQHDPIRLGRVLAELT